MPLVQKDAEERPCARGYDNANGDAPDKLGGGPPEVRVVGHGLDEDAEGVDAESRGGELVNESRKDNPPTEEGAAFHWLAHKVAGDFLGEETLVLGFRKAGGRHGLSGEEHEAA